MRRLYSLAALLCLCLPGISARGWPPNVPAVVSVSPRPHSISAEINTPIVVTFDSAIDPQSVDSSTVKIFGRWSGCASGQYQMENNNSQVRFTPSRSFSSGELIRVSVSREIRSQAGELMNNGYAWNFWVEAAEGTLELQETARISVRRRQESRVQTYGAYAGDLNRDGYTDLALPNERSNDVRVFLNDGTGGYSGFIIYDIPNGAAPSTNEGVDLNGDGITDFAVGNSQSDSVSIFIGDGTGGFYSVTNYQADQGVRGLCVMDLEGDGDMDVVTANRDGDNLSILANNGDGTFGSPFNIETTGSQETACAAADADGDGILDLFVGALGSNEIILLLGDGRGGFVFSTKVDAGGSPWMIAAGDVNGDGHVDAVSANSSNGTAAVVRGDGQGGLLPAVTYPVGGFPLAIDLGDLDGDGDLELVTSNFSTRDWTIYENTGEGRFVNPRTLGASSAGSCAVLHDRDNDGDLDMTGIDEIDDLLFLFDNDPQVQEVGEILGAPRFKLSQNYPNPFNPLTTIQFSLARVSDVELTVYNMGGEQVVTLVSDELPAGTHTVTWNAKGLSSGVYFYRLRARSRAYLDESPTQPGQIETSRDMPAEDFVETRKIVLVK